MLSAVLVLVAALVLILVVVLVLVLILVLVLVLVIHSSLPPILICGYAAMVACPKDQDLSFALKRSPAISPAKMAAVMPPAAAFSPPVKIPRNPSF